MCRLQFTLPLIALVGFLTVTSRPHAVDAQVIDLPNGFAVAGNEGAGSIPIEGPGTRLMWYPGKAAFRAGTSIATEWDAVNIGLRSAAFGAFATASGDYSVAIGLETTASGRASLAIGQDTDALGDGSIAAGFLSDASGRYAVAMGYSSTASGSASFALGGEAGAYGDGSLAVGGYVEAVGANSVSMGFRTSASGHASFAVGRYVTASGDFSMAMGRNASTNDMDGAFVFGDNAGGVVNAPTANSFTVRASGGTILYSNPQLSTGVRLLPGGGSWSTVSDRNLKQNFRTENGEQVLSAIASMPIQSWNYKSQEPSIRHLGPTAQDFRASFGLGYDDKHISTVDLDGVNMLAVQALEKRTRGLKAENEQLRARIAGLDAALRRLEAALAGVQK